MNVNVGIKKFLYIIFITINLLIVGTVQSQESISWTDSLMSTMSIEEKIGQLFMIRAFSKEDPAHIKSVKDQIKKYHIGGVCFFQGDPKKQVKIVNEYQDLSKVPLLVSIDGEWGLGMRFPDKAISFPRQITIGAINDNQLIYRMGKEIGRQCKLLGINVNFAPDVDINNNPNNPVINMRSFGEDRDNVSSKSYAYMRGMQDANIMACAKHFPGHGDTDVDSHYDLPIIAHTRERLDSIELYPFRKMIEQGISSVMVAHLQVPVLDNRPNRPTTVSYNVISELLRKELAFDGLVYTDAMEMKGVTKHFGAGMADLEAFLAGNDIILLPEDIEQGYNRILEAYQKGTLPEDRINESVRRILLAKEKLDLPTGLVKANAENIYKELNSDEAINLKTEIYERAITLANNEKGFLPIRKLKKGSFSSISLGAKKETTFQKRLQSYVEIQNFNLPKKTSKEKYDQISLVLSEKDHVIISIHDMSWYAKKNYGIEESQINFIKELSQKTNVVLMLFGTPYALKWFEDIPTVLVAYEDNDISQEVAAQALFGVTDISGKLPVTASSKYISGNGERIAALKRIGYSRPERVGLRSDTLDNIKDLVDEMIAEKAAPGCQVLIAKDNRIVYHQTFGYHTYDKIHKVKTSDIYDLASVTKVMATTISLMHLDDQDLFDLSGYIKDYIPEEDSTNKATIQYNDMLAHVGGLVGWIPFYKNTLTEGKYPKPSSSYYSKVQSEEFPHYVTDKLFLRHDYQDSIWRKVFSSQLRDKRDYRYSDLAFYIGSRTIENLSNLSVDLYAHQYFYEPIGLRTTTFNPLNKVDKSRIPPTEKDTYFRMATVKGTVHDMGAAMLGGVSGHAGLFSSATDLGVLMQMLLNKGYYGGYNFLSPETVEKYTQRHWASSRRGIGFDMKELNPDNTQNMSDKASRNTFGHLGFTGTAVFADPDHDIIYIFLSNRTYPTMRNNKLGKNNYRPRIQSVIYDALIPEANTDSGLTY